MGITAKAVITTLEDSDDEAVSAFAKVREYVQRVGEMESYVQAAKGVNAFKEASTRCCGASLWF